MLTDKVLKVNKLTSLNFLLCGILTLLTVACSSTPPDKGNASPVVENRHTDTEDQNKLELTNIIEQVKSELLTREQLFRAAEAFISNEQNRQARAILFALAKNASPSEQARLKSLVALTAVAGESVADVSVLQQPFDNPVLEEKRFKLLVEHYTLQGNMLSAAIVTLQRQPDAIDVHHQVLQHLSQLQQQQLKEVEANYPILRPHVALVNIQRNTGARGPALSRALAQFQQVYYAHPLAKNLPESLLAATALTPEVITEIAVMLPLSGRFASTGMAIKQGMLAAYYQLQERSEGDTFTLTFLDTAGLSTESLVAAAQDANWVIGPLLKENVEQVIPKLPISVKRLALNRVEPQQRSEFALTLADTQTAYFGLAPEDEAEQLAQHVHAQGYRHPILVAPMTGVGQRMQDAFVSRWQNLKSQVVVANAQSLDIVEFETIDNLGESLADALGVGQSEQNIKQIDRMTNRSIHDQTRSRQDIDAIVVFASPEQLSLINPMVEASISPFRQQVVPVYASSRSLERTDAPNQLRDLENVRFLDAPFLLDDQRWQAQRQYVSTLWPQQRYSFSRLFAFGYDAITLLPVVPAMALLPAYRYAGMTGELRMNDDAEIQRYLPMAMISEQNITPVVN